MTALVRAFLFLLCFLTLTSCTRDVYPKYLRMKQEAAWMEKTCLEGLAVETKYTYKGVGANIKIRCRESALLKPWIEHLESQLEKKGWQLKEREKDGNAYCLNNENIEMYVVPVGDEGLRIMGLRYPTRLCGG